MSMDSDLHDPVPAARRRPARASTRARAALPAATLSEFDGVRYLHLGDTPWVQGAMRLRKPRAIELEYVRRMMAWLLLREPADWDATRVVQLGLGAAALTRFCHGELGLRTTAVELNAQVVAACRQWFRLPADDERLRVEVADAGAWVADPDHHGSADVLCVDLYDHEAAAPALVSTTGSCNCSCIFSLMQSIIDPVSTRAFTFMRFTSSSLIIFLLTIARSSPFISSISAYTNPIFIDLFKDTLSFAMKIVSGE